MASPEQTTYHRPELSKWQEIKYGCLLYVFLVPTAINALMKSLNKKEHEKKTDLSTKSNSVAIDRKFP